MAGAPSAGAGPGLLGEYFFFLALGMSLPFLKRPLSALGGHPHQGSLGKETLALDGETPGGLGWPSCLPPLTV